MHVEIYELGLFGPAFGLGLLLGLGWCALYVLSWAWSWSWAWIDDSEAPTANHLISFVMRRMGWSDGDRWFRFRKGDQISDGASGFFYPLLTLVFAPTLAVLAVKIYPATLAALTLFLMARLARFARRHKKLFDKHIKDPDAHKA